MKMIKKNDKQATPKKIVLSGKITKDEGKHRTEIHYSTPGIEIYRSTQKELKY